MARLPLFSKMTFPHLERLAATIGLVLVSGSPRRKRILTDAGIPFEIVVPGIDEVIRPHPEPGELAMDLARQKVASVPHDGRRAYLGCDTIVVYRKKILTKPVDAADARRMLTMLSGKRHSVFSGVVLYDSKHNLWYQDFEESRVRFNHLTDRQLTDYLATGEPLDKAGAYGVQGMGGFLVDSVVGNVDNVVGLPMNAVERLAGRYRERYGEQV